MLSRPGLDEINEAAANLKDVLIHTPLIRIHSYDLSSDIYMKLENLQPIGSFKLRGVFNAVASLSPEELKKGLRTNSSGNTAQALGWTARYFKVPAYCVMPVDASPFKIQAARSYGVVLDLFSKEEFNRYIIEKGWEKEPYAFIDPWANVDLMSGHGTIGLEILSDLPSVDSVFVPVGGGGLICGVGSALKALKPSMKVYGVVPLTYPALYESFKAGRPVEVPNLETICDGVASALITDEMYPLLREVIDEVVLVSESSVKKTIKRLALRNKVIAEGAGALSVAAALETRPEERGKSVCVVSGGNIDYSKLIGILSDPTL